MSEQKIIPKEVIAGAILNIAEFSKNLSNENMDAINIMIEITPSQFNEAFSLIKSKTATLH